MYIKQRKNSEMIIVNDAHQGISQTKPAPCAYCQDPINADSRIREVLRVPDVTNSSSGFREPRPVIVQAVM